MEKYTALDLFFETGLRHLYKAEMAIYENLKVMAESSSLPQLKDLFLEHRGETEGQIQRLGEIFCILDIDPKASKVQGLPKLRDQVKELLKTLADMNFTDRSKGFDGILSEGKEMLRHFANSEAGEVALVDSGQKVEHYEIACYSTLCLLSDQYDAPEIAELLRENLNEEIRMEKRLWKVARGKILALAPAER